MCKECECPKYNKYYKDNKDKIIQRSLENYNNNKDDKLKKMKEYQEKHKDEIKAKANEKVSCECGGRYTKRNKSTHMKSKKHQEYVSNLEK